MKKLFYLLLLAHMSTQSVPYTEELYHKYNDRFGQYSEEISEFDTTIENARDTIGYLQLEDPAFEHEENAYHMLRLINDKFQYLKGRMKSIVDNLHATYTHFDNFRAAGELTQNDRAWLSALSRLVKEKYLTSFGQEINEIKDIPYFADLHKRLQQFHMQIKTALLMIDKDLGV